MARLRAIFVNRKDVLDETSEQYHIYQEIMSVEDRENIKKFNDNSFLVIPYHIGDDNMDIDFYIILRDTNVNCEAFFNGIYGLYCLIKEVDANILQFIDSNGMEIILDQITVVEDYVNPEMIEKMFSIIFKQ